MKRVITSIALVLMLATAIVLTTGSASADWSGIVKTNGIGWCGTC
jgi:hypothetical protein